MTALLLIYIALLFISAAISSFYWSEFRKILKLKKYYFPFIPFMFNDYRFFKKMIAEQKDIKEINEYKLLAKNYIIWAKICLILISIPFIITILRKILLLILFLFL